MGVRTICSFDRFLLSLLNEHDTSAYVVMHATLVLFGWEDVGRSLSHLQDRDRTRHPTVGS